MNVRKRGEEEIASRLPRHQKRDTFFISHPAGDKKKKGKKEQKQRREEMQDGGKEWRGRSGGGNSCWARCKDVKLFCAGGGEGGGQSVRGEPAERAGLKLEKFLKEKK